jgi:hypothetical protein
MAIMNFGDTISHRIWIGRISLARAIVRSAGTLTRWKIVRDIAGDDLNNATPLRNYGIVWDKKLSRSGMPLDESGWRWLRDQGVKSIVTFRMENEGDYRKLGFERVFWLPMNCDPPVDQERPVSFLKFIQDPDNLPVHVHCTAGRSRAGMMVALARYAVDGWPLDKALAEARRYCGWQDLSQRRVNWLYEWARRHRPGSHVM